jgi:phage/plasmid-like protein (TIGR03299 family)
MVQANDMGAIYGGVKVEGNKTIAEALELSGLNWEVKMDAGGWMSDKKTRLPENERHPYYLTKNPDGSTSRVCFNSVKGRYTTIQNADAFGWAESFLGEGKACVSSAGSIHEGRKVWMCLDFGQFDVLPEDRVKKHLLLLNSHDGSGHFVVQLLAHRIVCQNVLNWSMGDGNDIFKVRHTESAPVRMEDVKRIYKLSMGGFQDIEDAYKGFQRLTVGSEDQIELIYQSLGVTRKERQLYLNGGYDRIPPWVAHVDKVKELQETGLGSDLSGVQGTLWGTFNAVTEFCDHYRVVRAEDTRPDNKIESRLIAFDAKVKAQSFQACEQYLKKHGV